MGTVEVLLVRENLTLHMIAAESQGVVAAGVVFSRWQLLGEW